MNTFRRFSRSWKAQWRTSLIGLFILFCSLDAQVIQTPQTLEVQEGGNFTLKCNYSIEYRTYFWYHQLPGEPPSLILSIIYQTIQNTKGFVGKYLENGKESQLHRPKAELKDSGSYLCAVANAYSKVIFGSGTKLVVMPNLRNSTPSVYQLETKENLTACLITDYSPNSIKVKDHNNMKTVDGSVVVVKDDHENPTSLGAVIWRQKKDQFQCSVEHSGLNYKAENEGDGCSETQSSTPVFETDERLNLLSLTVLGLRLIFFKSVALNLILTFWAWSR